MSEADTWVAENALTDDLEYSSDDFVYTREFVIKAFNAGRESKCSQREAYQRGHRAGRAIQQFINRGFGNFIELTPEVKEACRAAGIEIE